MTKDDTPEPDDSYQLDRQVGFVLRRASQRHLSIFSELIPELTPTQFAALAKLVETGPVSQNALGRITAMDAATIKGVVDRLVKRGLLTTSRDERDRRRTIVDLSDRGRSLYTQLEPRARLITRQTLAPLGRTEQEQLLALLARIC